MVGERLKKQIGIIAAVAVTAGAVVMGVWAFADDYKSDYSIKSILTNYNLFTSSDVYDLSGSVGPIAVGGEISGETGIVSKGYTHNVDSFVGAAADIKKYEPGDGTKRLVLASVNKSNKTYSKWNKVKFADNYINMSEAFSNITAETESLVKQIDDANGFETKIVDGKFVLGRNYHIKLSNFMTAPTWKKGSEGREESIIYDDSEDVVFSANTSGIIEAGRSSNMDGLGIVYVFPNAQTVKISNSTPVTAHIIAPSAIVTLDHMDFSGCIIARKLHADTSSLKMYPYNGKLIAADGIVPVDQITPTEKPIPTEASPTIVVTDESNAILKVGERVTSNPVKKPEPKPTLSPLPTESKEPTEVPTPEVTEVPTEEPTETPTVEPTEEPTPEPVEEIEPADAQDDTEVLATEPTEAPTPEPTEAPVSEPVAEDEIRVVGTDEATGDDIVEFVRLPEGYTIEHVEGDTYKVYAPSGRYVGLTTVEDAQTGDYTPISFFMICMIMFWGLFAGIQTYLRRRLNG